VVDTLRLIHPTLAGYSLT